MNEIERALIKMLNAALNSYSVQTLEISLSQGQLIDCYNLAEEHQIHTLIYPYINFLFATYNHDSFKEIQAYAHYTHIHQANRMNYTFQILTALNHAGIKIIALKGLYLMNLYPKTELRLMGDIDILVSDKEFSHAHQIIESFGYRKKPGSESMWDITLVHEKYTSIELHHRLFTDNSFSNIGEFELLFIVNSLPYVQNGSSLYRPSDEDHLIYLFMHMAKHLTTGGFGLRQMADVYLLMKYGDYSFTQLIERLRHYHLTRFSNAIMIIIQQWFELNISIDIASLGDGENYYIDILKKDILDNGVYGKGNTDNIIRHIQLPYYQKSIPKWKLTLFFTFPPASKMRYRYNYISKHFFLLPIAWFHRWFVNLFIRKDLNFKEKLSCLLCSNDNGVSDRISLLNWLDL